jgi:hypothetical protein
MWLGFFVPSPSLLLFFVGKGLLSLLGDHKLPLAGVKLFFFFFFCLFVV